MIISVILASVTSIVVATVVIFNQVIHYGMEMGVDLLVRVALFKMNVVIAHHGSSSTYNKLR